jgi:asparagine synthase (glutamine-hydrolysing)
MAASMCHHSWYGTHRFSPSERFTCASISLTKTALVNVSDDPREPFVLIDGEIYDHKAQRRDLEAEGVRFTTKNHAELLAHGFQCWGAAFLIRLEGSFNALIWQPLSETLILTNDRFGTRPMYYANADGDFVFASEVKALLRHPKVAPAHSLRGLAQLFTFGHLLGDDTIYETVRVLPAAALLKIEAGSGRMTLDRYGRLEQGRMFATEGEALSSLDEGLLRAVERRFEEGGQMGLSLSGGLDSRTILAAAIPRATSLKTVSLGPRGGIDHRAASELARFAGATHHCHYLDRDFLDRFRSHLETAVILTDGQYLDQAITVPTLGLYRELGIDVLLRGHAGELLHMDKAYAFSIKPGELDFTGHAAVEQWLWSHLPAYMIAGVGHQLFRPGLREHVIEQARQSLRDALRESDGYAPPAQQIWALFVQQRLRRETAVSMQMFGSVVTVRLPYLDRDFVDAVMRTPPALKMGDRIQAFILGRRCPPFLGVVNSNTGTRIRSVAATTRLASLKLKVLAKLRVRGYQPYERFGLWLRRELRSLVSEMVLDGRFFDRGFADPDAVRKIVADHTAGRRNHTFLLMALVIFELGQRLLVEREAPVDGER